MGVDFETVKRSYEILRERERIKLADCLSEHEEIQRRDIIVTKGSRSGKGIAEYTSGGRIYKYDLSNWKWVELNSADSRFNCIVSLNMLETDPRSGNTHTLYDRIGIYVTYKRNKQYYKTEIYTDIDLPLDSGDMEKIAGVILEQFDRFSA